MTRARDAFNARWAVIGTIVVAAIVAFAVVPVFGSEHEDIDRLHMVDGQADAFLNDALDLFQPLSVKKCVISSNESIVTIEGNTRKGAGIFDHGMGVKSGGSNGTPCSETSGSEVLTITANDDQTWYKLRLDVEAKGNAWIHVTLSDGDWSQTHQLLTGGSIGVYNAAHQGGIETPASGLPYEAETTSSDQVEACANPNDSGPDSGIRDNCLWLIDPKHTFTSVSITTSVGAVSLEGGNDFLGYDASAARNGVYDSLFYRVVRPTAVDDGDDVPYSVDEDGVLNVTDPMVGVLENDSPGAPGNTLEAVLVSDPTHGTLVLNPNGTFRYTPDENYNGNDSFMYLAMETETQSESDSAKVFIFIEPVNDPPETVGGPLDATEDMTNRYTGADLADDIDTEEENLTVTGAILRSGTGTVNVVNEELVYEPGDFCGTALAEITFSVYDGEATTGSASVYFDVACLADDDSYSMSEREEVADVVDFATLTVSAFGVLTNDSDTPGELTALIATTPTNGGSVSLASDGSFTYTPGSHTWSGNDTSYQDTWQYTADYGEGDTQTATVTITVNRNLCQADIVYTPSHPTISGSFELLSAEGCKNWVPAEIDDSVPTDPTVLFQPATLDTTGTYDGTLTVTDLSVPDGSLATVILRWSPNPGVVAYDEIPSCEDNDPNPTVVDPILPDGAARGWCFYDIDPTLTGDQVWTVVWKVLGIDDPGFKFR